MVDDNLSTEQTRVVATYTTRRDAEMAQDRLGNEQIQSFITADDAGGMHPQLQRPHGVKLRVLGREAQRAHEALEEARLLPPVGGESQQPVETDQEDQAEGLTFSMERPGFTMTSVVYLVIFTLVILALLWAGLW